MEDVIEFSTIHFNSILGDESLYVQITLFPYRQISSVLNST